MKTSIISLFAAMATAVSAQNWIGSNLYYAAGLQDDTRTTFLTALQEADVKVLRVWLDGQHNGGTKGTTITEYGSLEVSAVGQYDDTVLEYYDDFMVEAQKYGVKLMISMHSWNSLDGGDIYTSTYGKSGFYTQDDAQTAFDNRIKHVLGHTHKSLGKTWAELEDYIFAFEAQNEAMIGLGADFIASNADWQCKRASTIKAALGSANIIVTTGGESWVDESAQDAYFQCADLDVVALHGYSAGDFSTDKLDGIVSKAKAGGKMVIFQEWGACYTEGDCSDSSSATPLDENTRINNIKTWADWISKSGMPHMYWQIIPNNDPHSDWDYEIGITEANLWDTFKTVGQGTSSYSSAWDWSKWLSTSGSSSSGNSTNTGSASSTGAVSTPTTTGSSTPSSTLATITTSAAAATTTAAGGSSDDCSWEGHCVGAVCQTVDDCADPYTCNNGVCGLSS